MIRILKLLLPVIILYLASCSSKPSESYSDVLKAKEQAASVFDTDRYGDYVTTISFAVGNQDTADYKNGIKPWVSIEKAREDIPFLIDLKKVAISEKEVTIVIDYPLTNPYEFKIASEDGFTKEELVNAIVANYYKLYAEEERTATIKTIPVEKRTTMYNRNQTNGKYEIWGHDIADLVLTDILVHKNSDGQIILALNIDS